MSNYNNNRNNGNHAKRRESFGFNQLRETDSNVPMKYLHSDTKVRETATIKVSFNGEREKKYVPIYKDGIEEEFLDTMQEFKTLLVNYPTMLENNQQIANAQLLFQNCLRGETLRDCKRIMQEFEQYTIPSREDKFASFLWELTNEVIGDKTSQYQMAYLRRTSKPRTLTVKK